MNRKYSILYVDDEISNLNIFKNTFRRNYIIFTAETAQVGLQILDREKIDLILTDQRMPEMTGVEFLKNVMIKYPQPSRILITAYTDFDALKDAVNEARIFQYIQKPWDEKEIQQIIDSALEIYQLRQKNIELTEKLSRLNKELLDLDKLKFQFLNIISHEIRTPLNGLVGATTLFKNELMESDYLKYQELFQVLEISTKRLEHFLLLAERITSFKANSYEIFPGKFRINDLIYEVVKGLHDIISGKKIKIEYELSEEGEENCFADRHLLEICLWEVIENAIKYSGEKDTVRIRTHSEKKQQIIEVIDEGPGFPESVLKHIYKPFITHSEITMQGMGLDLALIKLIIEAHDGLIDIRNNEKKGSTVRLVFNEC